MAGNNMNTVLAILASTPAKIRREVAAMSPREIRKEPAAGKWSVQQILAHLEDIEGPGFRGRVEAILQNDHPLLPSFDQEARAIEKQNDRTHEKMGELSAGEFVYEWAFHDLGHLKQILEVKRYALYPHIGNMRKYYKLS